MLEPVEIWADTRRAVRRSVHLECDLLSEVWDEPTKHLATDLSPFGVWLNATFPLDAGDEVLLSFTPPRSHEELVINGVVRRVELKRRACDPHPSGMAIEFVDVSPIDRDLLARVVAGLPPPLPKKRPAPRVHRRLAWVDTLLTWEEDLGDQVNIYEVSETLQIVTEEEFQIEALGELVTGPVLQVA